jgi:hypothetical protein
VREVARKPATRVERVAVERVLELELVADAAILRGERPGSGLAITQLLYCKT